MFMLKGTVNNACDTQTHGQTVKSRAVFCFEQIPQKLPIYSKHRIQWEMIYSEQILQLVFAFKVLQRQDCSINSGNSRDPVVDRWCPGGEMSTQI